MFNGIVGGGLAYRYVPPVGTDFVFLQVSDSGSQVQYVILGAVFIKQSKIFQQFEDKVALIVCQPLTFNGKRGMA